MYRLKHQAHWLALLAAILLLMQSFTLWHDAEHVFHHEDITCERFEAFGHLPSLDVIETVSALKISRFVIETFSDTQDHIFNEQYDAYAIRAPPSIVS